MGNYLKSEIMQITEAAKKHLPEEACRNMLSFFEAFESVAEEKNLDKKELSNTLKQYVKLIREEVKNPTEFGNFHKQELEPVNFFELAHKLISPFVDKEDSKLEGTDQIEEIITHLNKGENVMLLANHQAEADPTILSIILEERYPGLIKNMISVAGARVTTDPIVVPITRGQNVICVYSKKYFEMHADKKQEMLRHNSASMLSLRHLLNKGGKLVYVAPSGGRDRKDKDGNLFPAMFDPESIELMRLVGTKASKPTHFYPLALHTYDILPPPEKIKKEIGEERKICHSPVHIHFGKEYNMITPSQEEKKEKDLFRKKQANSIHALVSRLYEEITA